MMKTVGDKKEQISTGVKPWQGAHETGLFFVGIIYTGNDQLLAGTLNSVLRQKPSGATIAVNIFYPEGNLPAINVAEDVVPVFFKNKEELFRKFSRSVEQSLADYCIVLTTGEELFDGAFDSADSIFKAYSEINWLTGIQTFQTKSGFNIALGTTAMRRWTYKIYERNLYKNSGRYIPPASTFWRRNIWNTVSPHLLFVSKKSFFEYIWLAFFKAQNLYTCKTYFSTSLNHEKLNKRKFKQPNNFFLIEDSIAGKVKEFFFINNIPYLRLFYRNESGLTPVIRFDHSTQTYFLSEY